MIRTVWLFLGVVATSIALLLGSAFMWWAFARVEEPTETKERTIPYDGTQLKVEAVRGDVGLAVIPGVAGKVTLSRQLTWSADRPTVTENWDGTTLRLSAVCPGADQPDGPTCRAEYTLFVPLESGLEAKTMAGGVRVEGVYGPLRLTTVSGRIDVSNTTATLWARSGSGDITASGLRGTTADVETGTGHAYLTFTKAPTTVSAVVRAAGDVQVTLPVGDAYDVTAEGEYTEVEVRKDPESARKITARTGDGDVRVQARP